MTVSLGPVATLRNEGRIFALAIALVAVLGITILIHLLTQRLVHAPLADVLQSVARARTGDLSVRVPVVRNDEIGDVATGINSMLAEIESLQTHLRQRVDAATHELRDRNEQLVRSYESVLALRGELARARELATVGQTMAECGASDWNAAQSRLGARAADEARAGRGSARPPAGWPSSPSRWTR